MPPNVNSLGQLMSDVGAIKAQLTAIESRLTVLEAQVATAAKNAEIERLSGILTAIRADLDIVRETSSGVAVRVTALEGKRAKGK